jgi:hypothetical protein
METNGTNGSTALATIPASTALEPQSISEALAVAGHLAKSGVLGKSLQRPEAALAVIMAGRELGLTAMQSLRSLHVIEGKVVLSSDTMLALVKRAPACRYFKLVESTDKLATYETERVGEGSPTRMSFTIEQAQAAKLTGKDNWKNYPAAMLRARCIASLARAVYPDVLMGVYDTDEIQVRTTVAQTFVVGEIARDIQSGNLTPEDVIDVQIATEAQQSAAEAKVQTYRAEIAKAQTIAALQSIAAKVKAEPSPIRDAVKPSYDERKRIIAAPVEQPAVEREPGSDDE